MENIQTIAEDLVRLRMHLLALHPHLPQAAMADYQTSLTLAEDLLAQTRQARAQPLPPLSPLLTGRQQQIFILLKQGQTNRQIAENLGVTEGTIKVYMKTILKKLGVKNRTQAALLNKG